MDTHTHTHTETQTQTQIHRHTRRHMQRYTHTDTQTHTQTYTHTHRDTVLWVWGGFRWALKGEVRLSEVQGTSQEESGEDTMEAVDGRGHLFTETALTKAGHREGPGLWVAPRGLIVLSAQGPGLRG